MKVEIGELYYFLKSGNQVKAIEPVGAHMPDQCWIVERTEGDSKGKRMMVPEGALVANLDDGKEEK